MNFWRRLAGIAIAISISVPTSRGMGWDGGRGGRTGGLNLIFFLNTGGKGGWDNLILS